MMLWAAAAVLTIVVLAILLVPMLRTGNGGEARTSYDIAVYRDQLNELDRDIERGLLTADEAETARTEVERRLLAAVDQQDQEQTSAGPDRPGTAVFTAATIAVVVVAGSVGTYLKLGMPAAQDRPFAERQTEIAQQQEQSVEMARLTDQLRKRLEQNPSDPMGWALLGRSYLATDQFENAAEAFRKAFDLDKTDPDMAANLGEAIVLANSGDVIASAREAFDAALAIDPIHYKSRFFVAVSKAQGGNEKAALQDWVDLVAIAPADAPWVEQVRAHIQTMGAKLGIDPATVQPTEGLPAPVAAAPEADAVAPGPDRQQVEDAARMSPEQQNEMVNAMVTRLADRLKENPDDLEGWLRLGRSYQVLNRHVDAVAAFASAAGLAPANKDVLTEYASAILSKGGDPEKVPEAMIPVLERIKAIDSKDSNALWYLGMAENQAGRFGRADEYWNAILSLVAPGTPQHDRITGAINNLRARR